ncbi:MAG: hypothetical protein IPM83_15775 [Ignavibacteria bacterium]|nr:hypothetical protein [Ignavibacteria bacterium]
MTQLQNDGGTEGRSDTVTEGRSDGLKKLSDVEHSYVLVDTPGGLSDMMNELKGLPFSVDLETTGLDAMRCAIVGIALSAAEERATTSMLTIRPLIMQVHSLQIILNDMACHLPMS